LAAGWIAGRHGRCESKHCSWKLSGKKWRSDFLTSKDKGGKKMPAPKLTKASVANAIAAAAAAGLTPTAMVVQSDGSLRLEFFREEFNNAANARASNEVKTPKKWGDKR
jgi:hypothetical protein